MQSPVMYEPNTSELMRPDLQDSFQRSHIDPSQLSPFQRIVLTTDGTLTEILEAYLFEPIKIAKLSEQIISVEQGISALDLEPGNKAIERKIVLQGKISRRNFIYAESMLVIDRLDDKFKEELLTSKTPLGRLWLEHKIETFKEIIDSAKEPALELSKYFNIEPDTKLFSRTYRVISKGVPIMTITEKFPETYFIRSF